MTNERWAETAAKARGARNGGAGPYEEARWRHWAAVFSAVASYSLCTVQYSSYCTILSVVSLVSCTVGYNSAQTGAGGVSMRGTVAEHAASVSGRVVRGFVRGGCGARLHLAGNWIDGWMACVMGEMCLSVPFKGRPKKN